MASMIRSAVAVMFPVEAVESLPMLAADVVSSVKESVGRSVMTLSVTVSIVNVPMLLPVPVMAMT